MPRAEDDAKDAATVTESIPTYLSQAVLATLLCFPITGTIAIVYASQVRTKQETGDLDGARQASRKARRMIWLSAILGGVMVALTILVGLAVALYLTYLLETP